MKKLIFLLLISSNAMAEQWVLHWKHDGERTVKYVVQGDAGFLFETEDTTVRQVEIPETVQTFTLAACDIFQRCTESRPYLFDPSAPAPSEPTGLGAFLKK